MKRQSWTARLTYLPLAALAIANLVMVVSFWSSFSAEHAGVFQAVGGALALIELTALVVASDAASRGEETKAFIWRAVFAGVLFVNLVADFGAVATLTAGDAAQRGEAVARYDRAVADEAAASAEIARLRALLDAAGQNKPVAALDAELRSLAERRSRFEGEGLAAPARLLARIAALESAIALAHDIERQERARAASRAVVDETGARPAEAHPQFAGIVTLLSSAGVAVTSESVRTALAALLAVVMKLVLVFGLWVLSPRLVGGLTPMVAAPESMEGPVEDDAGSRKRKRVRRRVHELSPDLEAAFSDLEAGAGGQSSL